MKVWGLKIEVIAEQCSVKMIAEWMETVENKEIEVKKRPNLDAFSFGEIAPFHIDKAKW